MSDKAHFYLTGLVNKQNCQYWSDRHSRELVQKPLHSSTVTVWCAVAAFAVIGPYFFEDKHGNACTVTSERYAYMLQDFFIPHLQGLPVKNKPLTFNKLGLQVTLQKLQRTFCAHFFLDISFPDMATSDGQQDHPTYPCVIFTCGAAFRVWCIVHHHLAQLKN
jgi:hypothetical protein